MAITKIQSESMNLADTYALVSLHSTKEKTNSKSGVDLWL
tara:strand:- start:93 stop:212 length:120 start_codon:yes stop_codon:yes gene_type:complete